ncbi:MAG: nucleotidyltransferase family protein [Steroidobacteraceae bacterium]
MIWSDRTLPPPPVLHAMLREITETFARELAAAAPHAPRWTDFEWTLARAVSAMHGVSPVLSRVLRWEGPESWRHFTEAQRKHTLQRHVRITELLQLLDRRMRGAGIAAMALKGAALHAMGLYAAGDRPMADIDLLVRPADALRATRLLESLDFRQSGKTWKETAFSPVDDHRHGELGENSANDVKIELHERICERLPWRITDASDLIFPQCPHPGLNAYPSKASLMIHLLLHAAGSMTIRVLRLLQLLDLARLSRVMSDCDWDEMLTLGSRGPRLWWAFPPLMLLSGYYPSMIPDRILKRLAGDCPYLLKRVARRRALHGYSCSYLWVEALPGIEWAQSAAEILEYTVSRVRPGANHAALRRNFARTMASADRGSWARLPQGRRVLRWIASRQARPVTMHSVHAALAEGSQ